MKMSEIRSKSKEELVELVKSAKKELFNLRMQRATGALESQARFKQIRKDVARAKTLLNEKPGAAKPAKAVAAKAEKPAAKKKTAKAKKEA